MVVPETANVAITTILLTLVVVDIVGNTLVCLIIKRHLHMRNPINYLLVNLAISDILFATLITPKIIVSFNITHPPGTTGSVLCKLVTGGNLAWLPGITSVVTLVVIAVERYYTVLYPLDPNKKLTHRKLKVIVLSSWVFSIIFNTPKFLVRTFDDKKSHCVQTWPKKWMITAYCLAWLFLVVFAVGIMIVLYSKVAYTLWCKPDDGNPLNYQQRGVMKVRKRVTLMVISVSVIFTICWGAESVEYVLRFLTTLNITFVHITIVDTMVLLNSAVNPFVYALLNHQFRHKIRGVMCCTSSVIESRPWAETGTEESVADDTKL